MVQQQIYLLQFLKDRFVSIWKKYLCLTLPPPVFSPLTYFYFIFYCKGNLSQCFPTVVEEPNAEKLAALSKGKLKTKQEHWQYILNPKIQRKLEQVGRKKKAEKNQR